MNHVEAMKQALEAADEALPKMGEREIVWCSIEGHHLRVLHTALRTAIAEAEKQEPRCAVIVEVFGKDWRLDYMSLPVGKHRLYTQEYVYTTPPAAQRQPLTDEQISDLWCKVSNTDFVTADTHVFARAIEAAHGIGEKNHSSIVSGS